MPRVHIGAATRVSQLTARGKTLQGVHQLDFQLLEPVGAARLELKGVLDVNRVVY